MKAKGAAVCAICAVPVIKGFDDNLLAQQQQWMGEGDPVLENIRRASAGDPMMLTRIGPGDGRPGVDRRGALTRLMGDPSGWVKMGV